MNKINYQAMACIVAACAVANCRPRPAGAAKMTFFVTSDEAKRGGNLGGLTGADERCQALADAVGAGQRSWHAYLSAAAANGEAVNARDRIGRGPWINANGAEIASSVEDLHRADNRIRNATALDERGQPVGYWHDMLTGSNPDGTLASGDVTCRNWTSTQGHALVGHSDRGGEYGGARAASWNSAHTTSACTLPAFESAGGKGRFYCFAIN